MRPAPFAHDVQAKSSAPSSQDVVLAGTRARQTPAFSSSVRARTRACPVLSRSRSVRPPVSPHLPLAIALPPSSNHHIYHHRTHAPLFFSGQTSTCVRSLRSGLPRRLPSSSKARALRARKGPSVLPQPVSVPPHVVGASGQRTSRAGPHKGRPSDHPSRKSARQLVARAAPQTAASSKRPRSARPRAAADRRPWREAKQGKSFMPLATWKGNASKCALRHVKRNSKPARTSRSATCLEHPIGS